MLKRKFFIELKITSYAYLSESIRKSGYKLQIMVFESNN